MTAHIAAYGRLAADPESGESRDGRPWAAGRMSVVMPLPYGAEAGTAPPALSLGVLEWGGATAAGTASRA